MTSKMVTTLKRLLREWPWWPPPRATTSQLRALCVVVTTTREGYGELKHRFTGTNLPLGVVGSASTPAEYLGVTSIGLAKLFKVQGHRWTVTANTFVGDIAKIGADESALATENASVVVNDNFFQGIGPTEYIIPNLIEGVPFFVRAKVKNDFGYGPLSTVSSNTPKEVPGVVRFVQGGHAPHIDEIQSIQTAATHKDEIQIVTVTADHVSEVQSVRTSHSHGSTVSGSFYLTYGTGVSTSMEKQVVTVHGDGGAILSGGYKLHFGNENTTCLKFDATATEMKTALQGLSTLTTVDVFRSGDATAGYSYTIAFMDSTADRAELTVKGGPKHGHESCRGLWYGGERSPIPAVPTEIGRASCRERV